MGDFGTGFATGFFNKLSTDIDKRSEDARNYFNEQVKMARTVGLENRKRVRATVDESVNIAKRLQDMGVPKDIIMAQADMDPGSLGDFYSQVEKLRLESKVPMDEAAYRAIYKLSGTYKAPNEDFATFFSRMYEPIVSAATSDPKGFKQDPEGSIFATAFGFNAMERADKKLATVEVAPGLTAQQAIEYGDQVTPNRSGGSFVKPDPVVLREVLGEGKKTLTPQVMESIRSEFEAIVGQTSTELAKEFDTTKPDQIDQLKVEASKRAYEKMVELYVGEESYLSYIRSRYNLAEDGSPLGAKEEEAPAEEVKPATAPDVAKPATPAVEAPVAPLSNNETLALETYGSSYFQDNGDGTVTYTGPDGTKKTSSIASLRAFLNK